MSLDALRHPFFEGLRPTLHISHRGGALVAPENTMFAFRQAIELHRTDMLELDVHATADGVLVVAHDDTLERCTNGGARRIRELDHAELRTLDAGFSFRRDDDGHPHRGAGLVIPRFAEVLEAFPNVRLNVELKPDSTGFEEALAAELRAAGAVSRVCIGSEEDAVGARLHQVIPEACHFYPRDALIALVFALKSGSPPPVDDRFTVLDMPLAWEGMRLFDAELASRARELGKWVNVWTVDDEADMLHCIECGAGGIMTDRPDRLRSVLDRISR
jgi:glycerophosphoryl diester phosphodiesterase